MSLVQALDTIPVHRPRNRHNLMDPPAFHEMRERLVTFLEDHGHEKPATGGSSEGAEGSSERILGVVRGRGWWSELLGAGGLTHVRTGITLRK